MQQKEKTWTNREGGLISIYLTFDQLQQLSLGAEVSNGWEISETYTSKREKLME
jgi:hypothetical protein